MFVVVIPASNMCLSEKALMRITVYFVTFNCEYWDGKNRESKSVVQILHVCTMYVDSCILPTYLPQSSEFWPWHAGITQTLSSELPCKQAFC